MSGYNGKLISELGVEKYLKGKRDSQYSNIDFFDRGSSLNKKWQECNFGCHGPSYRTFRPSATWNQTLLLIDKISPSVAGIADGIQHQAVEQPKNIAAGVGRTAEGLHLMGEERFSDVGGENLAALELIETTYKNIVEFEISVLENPLMQAATTIINDYISVIPEWVLEQALESGAFIFNNIDKTTLLRAGTKGVFDRIPPEDLDRAVTALKDKGKRVIGKQIGKKLTIAISAIIATQISKKIMSDPAMTFSLKRRLAHLKRAAKPMGGGLGKALVILLKAQGLIGTAAKSSRTLNEKCPTTWKKLRYKLHGADMVYFLIEGVVNEYVDRLSLLEKQPQEFFRVMEALIRDRLTKKIFYPGAY